MSVKFHLLNGLAIERYYRETTIAEIWRLVTFWRLGKQFANEI